MKVQSWKTLLDISGTKYTIAHGVNKLGWPPPAYSNHHILIPLTLILYLHIKRTLNSNSGTFQIYPLAKRFSKWIIGNIKAIMIYFLPQYKVIFFIGTGHLWKAVLNSFLKTHSVLLLHTHVHSQSTISSSPETKPAIWSRQTYLITRSQKCFISWGFGSGGPKIVDCKCTWSLNMDIQLTFVWFDYR